MRLTLSIVLLCICTAFGDEFFNAFIKGKPKGVVKDFYIWQYLQKPNLSHRDINDAYKLLSSKNAYIRNTINNLGIVDGLSKDIVCANMELSKAINEDVECLSANVSKNLSAVSKLPGDSASAVISKLSHSHKTLSQAVEIMTSGDMESRVVDADIAVFNTVYGALSYESRSKLLTSISIEKLGTLVKSGDATFFGNVGRIILDSGMQRFKDALLELYIENAPHGTTFLIGINELRFGSKHKAMEYFKLAEKKANSQFFRDRAIFWQYMVSKDSKYLQQLLKSPTIDIFSIYAFQKLNEKPEFRIVHDIPATKNSKPPFDVEDPYVWQNIVNTMLNTKDSLKLANAITYFSYKETVPHLAYLMQKIDNFSTNYYIMPYDDLVKFESKSEKSFVYSIAKQESHFIPTAISKSFALGIMQIMPANVEHFAKDMGIKNISYNDLFKPKISLEMGTYYIRKLKKEYQNPLFVAYAYNGGPGFLRRLLARNELFLKNREYEPWLSMELIPNEESRFYGMKVVANYIMYSEIMGSKVNLEELLNKTLIYTNKKIKR